MACPFCDKVKQACKLVFKDGKLVSECEELINELLQRKSKPDEVRKKFIEKFGQEKYEEFRQTVLKLLQEEKK